MESLGQHLWAALASTAATLAVVLGPAAACALVLHQLQRITAARLTATFGPRAALVTGWLGVPIHELSHVALCMLFMHEVEEVKLFTPGAEDGTLGVVRHRAPAGNPWAEIGRFFIGVAPLIGGAFALWLIARVLLPSEALERITRFDGPAGGAPIAWAALTQGAAAAASVLDLSRVAEPTFWLFLYLTTCVGAHLAPSGHDLRGAARGALALFATLLAAHYVAGALGLLDPALAARVAAFTTPIVAMLVLAVFLSSVTAALVLVVTLGVERFRGATDGQLGRLLRDHGLRLGLAGLGCVAFAWVVLRYHA